MPFSVLQSLRKAMETTRGSRSKMQHALPLPRRLRAAWTLHRCGFLNLPQPGRHLLHRQLQ